MAQFEYVIIACHEELFHILNDEIYDVPTEVIIKRCEWLNALISSSMLPSTQRFIDIQEQICRVLVFHQPCNEYYLINLGMVIFKKADMYPFKHIKFTEYISHAIRTFKAAIETNDKPMIGLADAYLEGLSWFKIHKLNYLTKKAPIFICESLQSIENDEPGFLTRRNTTLKKVTKKSRRKNAQKVYKEITSDKFESSSGKTKKSASVHFIPKKINANSKCNQYHMYKNDVCCLNLHKILTPKQLSSNKTSLFQSCRKYSDERDDVHYPKKESLSLTIMINPPTHYSRLMLGRSFRANHQYTESLKCFNYIRKMTTFVTLVKETFYYLI